MYYKTGYFHCNLTLNMISFIEKHGYNMTGSLILLGLHLVVSCLLPSAVSRYQSCFCLIMLSRIRSLSIVCSAVFFSCSYTAGIPRIVIDCTLIVGEQIASLVSSQHSYHVRIFSILSCFILKVLCFGYALMTRHDVTTHVRLGCYNYGIRAARL